MADDLDLSPVQQGWLGASVVFGNLFLAIPLNLWLSRYRPWRVAFITFLGIGGFTLLQAFSPNFAILIIGRVGLGLSFIANQSPRALIIQQWSPPGKVHITTGVVFAAIDIIMGVIFFLTPVLNNALGGWRPVLMVMGGIGLTTAVAWTMLGREREFGEYRTRLESQQENPLLSVLRHKQLWLMGLGMCAVSVGGSAFEHFWPTHAEEGLLVSNNVPGAVFGLSLFGAGAAVYLFYVIPFFSRFRTTALALSGFSTAAVNAGLLFFTSPIFLILLSIPRGVANLYFPLLMIMVYQLPGIRPREVAVGIAFMQTSIWLGNAIGPAYRGLRTGRHRRSPPRPSLHRLHGYPSNARRPRPTRPPCSPRIRSPLKSPSCTVIPMPLLMSFRGPARNLGRGVPPFPPRRVTSAP